MIDFEIQRCTRHCAVTGREFKPGEVFYSVLLPEGNAWKRLDYSAESWHGPPEGCIAWWRTQMPAPEQKRQWAPSEVMVRCLEELAERPDRADFRYVLALLMIRRRILRLEETRRENGTEILRVYCPLTDVTYEIPAVVPSEERLQELEQELLSLLEGDERELALGPDSAHQSVGGSAS
ncbi:hypothetical protein [Thermogutta sp.]|uniref:hypothetical protein n=1 Tax=Thermogutta sp. TaxID=1962930 RepID=UPI00321FF14A